MFRAYFDASGSENDQPCLAVAGFAAGAEAWTSFEEQWLARLAHDGLEYFHRRELRNSGWDKRRKSSLINDLIQITASNVARKFGVVVQNESLSVLTSEERRKWHITPYSLAGRTCAARVREWAGTERLRFVPELVFEDGDTGKGELIKLIEESRFATPIFKYSHDRIGEDGFVVKGAVPLQAGDLLAFQLFGPQRNILRDGYIKEIPKTYTELDKIPGELGVVDREHVQQLVKGLAEMEALRKCEPGQIFIAQTPLPSKREI